MSRKKTLEATTLYNSLVKHTLTCRAAIKLNYKVHSLKKLQKSH